MRTFCKATVLASLLAAVPAAFAAVDADEQAEMDALRSVTLSLQDAVAAAIHAAPGSALEAGLEVEGNRTAYEITVANARGQTLVEVDPHSGAVLMKAAGTKKQAGKAEDGEAAESKAVAAQPVDLARAIAFAQEHAGGKALEATFESHDGAPRYEVGIVRDGKMHEVVVDPRSGKVLMPKTE